MNFIRTTSVKCFAAALLLMLVCTFYTVDESEFAVVTQFGRPVELVRDPGLHCKWPWQSRIRLNSQLQSFNPLPSELLTRDRKNLIVDSFVIWRLDDPQKFLQAVVDRAGAESRLQDIVKSELSIALGNHDLSQLVATNPRQVRVGQIMDSVKQRCAQAARDQYGIKIEDISLRRINLPEENKESVFARMRSERDRIARGYRAEGAEQATRIRAAADRQKTQILARAYEQAESIKGQGDAQAMSIYANAYNRAPEFYKMTRTLDAYKKFMNDKTTVILSSDSDLMRLLTSGRVAAKP